MDYTSDYPSGNTAANAGQDAKAAAAEAADTIKTAAGDMAGQAQQSASKVADHIQQAGEKAVDATRAYAKDAVDSAGRKVRDMKSQLETAKTSATDYINEDPMRAVKIAAIGGALLSAALIGFTRRNRY